ncbi:CurL C-terminal domain-containing protein [Streptomyces sp. YKOK-I1]
MNLPPTPTEPLRVLALSARDPESLAEARRRLAAWLESTPDADLDDVALTLWTGRERFPCRDAVTAASVAEAVAALPTNATTSPSPVRAPGDGPVLLLDGTAPAPIPVLPEVADALRLAREHADCADARTVAALHGLVSWLRARGVTPRAVLGTGPGALAAAAARGDLPLADALLAAATDTPTTDDHLPKENHTGTPAVGTGTPAVGTGTSAAQIGTPVVGTGTSAVQIGTPVVRIGPPSPDSAYMLASDPLDALALDRADALALAPADGVSAASDPGVTGALALDPVDSASPARLIAALWRQGYDVDTSLGRPGRRVRLPGYPFRRREPGGPAPADASVTRALTPYEQRWLFYDLVRHGSSGDHNAAVAAVVPGPPPAPDALSAAFRELQRRHPALRTVFGEPGGRWRARTLPTPQARPAHLAPDPDGGPEALRVAVLDEARQPLRLRDSPLVRCCLRAGPAHWALALAVYEPLTAALDLRRLLGELLGLAQADAAPRPSFARHGTESR